MTEEMLSEHIRTYGPHSSAWLIAFNEIQRRHALRVKLQSTIAAGAVSVVIHLILKWIGV